MNDLRPAYEPVNAHYVNPPGTQPLPLKVAIGGFLCVLAAGLLLGMFITLGVMNLSTPDGPTRPIVVTPTTYGAPSDGVR